MRSPRLAFAAFAFLLLLPAAAQEKSAKPSFAYSVVSVHPTKNIQPFPDSEDLPDGLRIRSATLFQLISQAYGFSVFQVSAQEIEGGPKWLTNDHFDVDAKLDESDIAAVKADDAHWNSTANFITAMAARTPTTRMLMLRALLADRFQLQVHDQLKTLPIYTLLVAKPGQRVAGLKNAKDPEHGSLSMSEGFLHGEGVPVSLLPSLFAREMERPVLDGTGLPGSYDFTLKWTPGLSGAGESGGSAPLGPGLLTAIQEQLGLRLQAGKGPVHVTVIDHAEQPSEN